jgi:hypothetical protein
MGAFMVTPVLGLRCVDSGGGVRQERSSLRWLRTAPAYFMKPLTPSSFIRSSSARIRRGEL